MANIDSTKIDNIINEFLADFDVTATLGTDFAYWYNESLITYALVVSDKMSKWFMEFAETLSPEPLGVDVFILSLLHEVGHHQTIEDLDSLQYALAQRKKNELEDSNAKDDVWEYFQLYDELEATLWAVDYINDHRDELDRWWYTKLLPAILEFYDENEVTDDED